MPAISIREAVSTYKKEKPSAPSDTGLSGFGGLFLENNFNCFDITATEWVVD